MEIADSIKTFRKCINIVNTCKINSGILLNFYFLLVTLNNARTDIQ